MPQNPKTPKPQNPDSTESYNRLLLMQGQKSVVDEEEAALQEY